MPSNGFAAVVREYGQAVAVTANGPDDRIDQDRLDAVHAMLRHHWTKTAEVSGITWVDEPKVLRAPNYWGRDEEPRLVNLYDEYDEEGNGIGEPTGQRYEWYYGWLGRGYKSL